MKTFSYKIILGILLLMLTAACKKNNLISDKQTVLFQFEYINYAWGYQHTGYFIDKEGNVLTYTNPREWNFPGKNLTLSDKQMAENVAMCSPSSIKISKEDVQKYYNYIKNISSSKVTALKNVAADAGSSEFFCFQLSEKTGMYNGSLIKMEGNFTCENLNFYSKKVVSWMKGITKSIYQKY
jgi:hypothetical protein